jgi:3-oxoadipate enol-lactonase
MELININGQNIHYRYIENLEVRNFLFLNPLGSDFRIWDEILPYVNDYANVILYDKRGHGLSDFSQPVNGLFDYAEDAYALLEKLSIQKATVIGLSVGGQIAAILASKHPELVDKLVLCDTAQKIGTAQTWNQRIETVRHTGLQSISADIMKRWFSSGFHDESPQKVAGYKNMLERSFPDAYIRTCEFIRDTDLSDLVQGLNLPVLCIVGDGDLSTTPAEVETMARLIKGANFQIIEGSGHIPCVDNPRKFVKLIIDFINQEK